MYLVRLLTWPCVVFCICCFVFVCVPAHVRVSKCVGGLCACVCCEVVCVLVHVCVSVVCVWCMSV